MKFLTIKVIQCVLIIGIEKNNVIYSLTRPLPVTFVALLFYDVIHMKENLFSCASKRRYVQISKNM